MQIVLLRDECGSGRTCPNINSTSRGSFIIQGYVVPSEQRVLPQGEAMVEVPLSLIPELASASQREGLSFTDRGTVLLAGLEVVDEEALATLALPAGETAVEIPREMLPELATMPELEAADAA